MSKVKTDNIPVACCRCSDLVEPWHTKGWIDGERAHSECVLEDMDENGMDDFHGDN